MIGYFFGMLVLELVVLAYWKGCHIDLVRHINNFSTCAWIWHIRTPGRSLHSMDGTDNSEPFHSKNRPVTCMQ